MDFTVTQIGPEDIGMFRELLDCFGREFGEPETYTENQPSDEYLKELLESTSFIALCAICNRKVIGGLAAYELKKFGQSRSELYIYDLAVAKLYRRNGIATALIENLKTLAKQKRAWVIYVQADHGDTPATELYSKIGVREEVLHFDIAPCDNDT